MDYDLVAAASLMEPPYDGSLARLLQRAVEANPERDAINHDGETISYRAFGDRVERIAGGLHESGFEPGDRLAVYLPNGIPFCETIWGCIHAGVIASPLNPQYRRREIEYQLEHADVEAIVVDSEDDEHAIEVATDLGIDVITAAEGEYVSLSDLADAGEPTLVDRDDDDVLLQPYTSGTTGKPKGVLLTHYNFRVQVVDRIASYSASRVDGDGIALLPMYHISGLIGMFGKLCTGQTLHMIRPDQWDPERVLEVLDEHDVPSFAGVATMFGDLLDAYDPDKYDLSTLVSAGQGGEKLPVAVQEEFEETFGVTLQNGYGLTEATAGTHATRSSTLGRRTGSIGQPFGHTHAKIVDEEGNEVPRGEEGELLIDGPQIMKGYYDNPEANEKAFTEDGYLRTGDIASRDADNYYYIKGREKEMILTAGYNVYPKEVEETLYEHPSIHEAAVVGIPDDRRGETVAAMVAPKEGADLTAEDVTEYVLGELAPYKHPRVVEICEELPKTGSGKIHKPPIRDALTDGSE